MRVLDLGAADGIELRLLPDRALDASAASFAGIPIAWISPVGERPPLTHRPQGDDWRSNWGGGLVTTCGLRNVGAPSEGHGLHGEISQQPAEVEMGDTVKGVVREGPFVLEREWIMRGGTVTLRDVCRNEGAEPEPAPFLYHVNLRFSGTLSLESGGVRPRDADAAAHMDWQLAPAEASGPERVYEHVDPRGEAVLAREDVTVHVRWSLDTLPRVWQWVDPPLGALGIEPANCSVLGRAHDRAEGRLPFLAPGEERETWVEIQAQASIAQA